MLFISIYPAFLRLGFTTQKKGARWLPVIKPFYTQKPKTINITINLKFYFHFTVMYIGSVALRSTS